MFDDWVTAALLIFLIAFIGWIVGIIGFFRAGRARQETAALREDVRRLQVLRQASASVPPVAQPEPLPAPIEPAPQEGPEPETTLPAAPQVSEPVTAPPRRDIEALLAMRWGVWLGAAALLLAGVFLVRYAVDQGLLGPAVRTALAGLLGVALIGVAEWLSRRELHHPENGRADNGRASLTADQAPPALAAGGVAVLFGAAYAAGPLYGLVPPLLGFVLLAAAGFAGLALSLRQGPLVAALGIACAFVTPALVQTEAPSLPGLFGYLLVVTAAALAVVRTTAWTWLGWTATVAAAVWVMVVATFLTKADVWAPALFVPAAAALNLMLLPSAALDHPVGRRLAWIPFAVLGCAGLLICLTVDDWAARTGVLLLAPLAIGKGSQEPRLDRLPWLSAVFFLLVLLLWALPDWQPTGEAITIEGRIQAVLPGAWAPDVIQPLLQTAALMAVVFAAAGLWLERRVQKAGGRPLVWSALTAAVPLLTLCVTYAQVRLFQTDGLWAGVALLLAAVLVGAAALARREGDTRRAGVHAAGVVGALALGCAMLLADHWLTAAISLFLPALAWIEAEADLPPLRRVALAVAGLVLIRLLLNWYVLEYAFGPIPVVNGLLAAYAVPALAFGLAATVFRRRADDFLVAVLQAGACAFATVLVAMEIHHWATRGELTRPPYFLEDALHVCALFVLAMTTWRVAARAQAGVLRAAALIQAGLGLAGGVLLLLWNPTLSGEPVGVVPLLNALLPAYAIPAVLALLLRHEWRSLGTDTPAGALRPLLAVYAVAAGFVWLSLEVRHLFHPEALSFDLAPVEDPELWAWSGAWLSYGILLMSAGIRTRDKKLRITALAIVALAAGKVFLIDMAGLVGLWRVLSFLGLGIVLIGLGAAYRRFVGLQRT